MKNIVTIVLCLFAVLACNSCVPQPPPVPPVVVVDAGPTPAPAPPSPPPVVIVDAGPPAPEPIIDPSVRGACANLAALHCAEGMPGCEVALQKAFVSRLTTVPLDCLISARSKGDVRACGRFVACP